jgi:hypothetical protein
MPQSARLPRTAAALYGSDEVSGLIIVRVNRDGNILTLVGNPEITGFNNPILFESVTP